MSFVRILAFAAALASAAATAQAQPAELRGSDTLFGVVTDSINQSNLQDDLVYLGGGSGLGESALVNGAQNIAPMSRSLNPGPIEALQNQGADPIQSVIGLDGVSLYIRATEPLQDISIATIRDIYLCNITDWGAVLGSDKSGPIAVFRRNDASGTTDVFRTLVGISAFGSCVTELATTEAIADVTSTDPNAIGYSGLSGLRTDQNKALAVRSSDGGTSIPPSTTTIRNFSYPLSRRLFVNWVTGARAPTTAEQALLDNMLDRDFMDPILIANEFVTCLPLSQGGCP